jgi:hypothetical protein
MIIYIVSQLFLRPLSFSPLQLSGANLSGILGRQSDDFEYEICDSPLLTATPTQPKTKVARFFLVRRTKMGKKVYQMSIKYAKWPQNIPNDRKIDQMLIKCTNISHCKTFQDLPKLGFWV